MENQFSPSVIPTSKIVSSSPSFLSDKLPTPSPRKSGGGKLVFAAITALLLICGAAFWLTRDGQTRDTLREQAAAALDDLTQGTPLASMGNVLRGATPVPHVGEYRKNPTGEGGTSGPAVQGAVAAPLDRSLPPELGASRTSPPVVLSSPSSAGANPQPQAVAPKASADTTVRPDFIDDLAGYVVARYKPGQNGGGLGLSAQGINQRYGVKMTGLAGNGQSRGDRAGILRYVFSPTMIQELYGLYVDRFLEALQRHGTEKSLTPEQMRQLFTAIAGRSVLLAGGLEGVAALPDLSGRLKKLEHASQNTLNVNAEMMQIVFELDELRENKAPRSRIDETQARVTALSTRYRKVLDERTMEQRTLLADIRKGGGTALDDDTLLFLARWLERRMRDTPQSLDSARSAAGVLRDLARRCSQTGASLAANAPPQ
jgi:hypothetical protein